MPIIGITASSRNPVKATGGDIVISGGFVYHVFKNSGTFAPTQSFNIDAVIIAGGGGGAGNGTDGGGGGGAGGYRSISNTGVTAQNYTITVGGGGAVGAGGTGSSAFSTSTTGGGNGGTFGSNGGGGGSGGGGGRSGSATTGGAGNTGGYSPVEGYAGGNGGGGCMSAGGGGGAGGVGNNNCSDCGGSPTGNCTRGGIGSNAHSTWWSAISSTMTGITDWTTATTNGYIAGGGAGMWGTGGTNIPGGDGGGGSVPGGTVNGTPGVENTGSGGGPGKFTLNAAAGGKGFIVVRYAA